MYLQSVTAAAVMMVVLSLFLAWSLYESHARYAYGVNDDLANLTLNLERQLEARLQSSDLILQAAAQEFKRMQPEDEQKRAAFNAMLEPLAKLLPGLPQVRGADREGRVVYGQGLGVSPPLSVAHRKYVAEAKASTGLVVGLPLLSRVSRTWVMPLARQLQDAQGAYAGVVYANLELEQVSSTLQGLRLGDKGVASLVSAKGDIIVRSLDEPVSGRVDETAARRATRDTINAIANGLEAQSFESKSLIDGVTRVTMVRRVGVYPVYVAVGLEKEAAFAAWRNEVAGAALVWLFLMASSLYFLSRQRQFNKLQGETMAQLEEARLRADKASETKSQFLANMSHEIRTPMNGVLGFAQLGQRLDPGSAEAPKMFSRIVDAGKLLQAILDDVLDMSMIEAGKMRLHAEPTSLRDVAKRAIDLVKDAAEGRGVAVHLLVEDEVPALLMVDPIRVEQVFLNLLSNAVKFTDCGKVEFRLDVADASVLCSIKDTGMGMSKEHLARLFTPFDQGDATRTRRHGGTGLGLVITQRLVQTMGGSISATSELRIGTTFTVRLPLSQTGSAESQANASAALVDREVASERTRSGLPEATETQRLRGLHFLVVEDNEVNQLVIHGMLQREGASAEVVSDGYAAVDRVKLLGEKAFDAVLLDIMMPGIDGYETSRRIHAVHPSLPIVGQTAHAMPEELAHCKEAGMLDRIVKPIVVDDLVRTIRKHIAVVEGRVVASPR